MNRFLILGLAAWLGGSSLVRAQNDASAVADRQAATEMKAQLAGKMQDLTEAQDSLKHQIDDLKAQLQELRDKSAKPNTDAVERDEFRKLAEQVKDIDEKRAADKKLILEKISALANVPPPAAVRTPKAPKVVPVPEPADNDPATSPSSSPDATKAPDGNYEGYQHTVKSGETLIAIIKAYNKEYDLKLTLDQVLKHPLNAKVKPEKLYVGQKVFIPSK